MTDTVQDAIPNESATPDGTPAGKAEVERFEDMTGDPTFENMISDLPGGPAEPVSRPPTIDTDNPAKQEPTHTVIAEEQLEASQEGEEVVEGIVPSTAPPAEDATSGQSAMADELAAANAQLREVSSALIREREANQEAAVKKEVTFDVPELVKDEEELSDILSSPERLNAWGQNLVRHGAALGREAALREAPEIVGPQVRNAIDQFQRSSQFYKDNSDLEGNRNFVNFVASEIINSHRDVDGKVNSDFTQTKLMQILPGEVRKRIGGKSTPAKTQQKGKPSFAKPPGTRAPGPGSLSPMESALDGMLYDDEKALFKS